MQATVPSRRWNHVSLYVSQNQVRGEQKRRVSVHSYTYINQRRCQLDDDVPAAAPPESVTKVVVVTGVIEVDDDVISLVRGPSDTRRTNKERLRIIENTKKGGVLNYSMQRGTSHGAAVTRR